MLFNPGTGRCAMKNERVHGIERPSNKAGWLLEWLAKLWQLVPIYVLGTVAVKWPTQTTVFKLPDQIGQIIWGQPVWENLVLVHTGEKARIRPFDRF